MPIPVTLLYGGICTLLLTALGGYVSMLRLRLGVSMGKEPPPELVRPIRAHGNAAEWVPLGILLLAMLEVSGVAPLSLHVMGGTLVLARVFHAAGALLKNRLTMVAATLTYCLMTGMGGWSVWLHFASAR